MGLFVKIALKAISQKPLTNFAKYPFLDRVLNTPLEYTYTCAQQNFCSKKSLNLKAIQSKELHIDILPNVCLKIERSLHLSSLERAPSPSPFLNLLKLA